VRSLDESAWPWSRLGEALRALPGAQACVDPSVSIDTPVAADSCGWNRDRLLQAQANRVGLHAVAVDLPHARLTPALGELTPSVLPLPSTGEPRFLLLLGRNGKRLRLLGPDHQHGEVDRDTVRARLCATVEERIGAEVDEILCQVNAEPPSPAARVAMIAERLRQVRVDAGWILRPSPVSGLSGSEWRRLASPLAGFVAVHIASQVVWILAWIAIADAALLGQSNPGWVAAAALMLAGCAALRVCASRLQLTLSVRLGVLVRRRLFEGTMALDSQVSRRKGIGHFLGTTFEAQALESVAVGGGCLSFGAALELLVVAIVAMAMVPGGWLVALGLGVWAGLSALLAARHLAARRRWTMNRRAISQALIERMLGHRTRLAQADRAAEYAQEDESLHGYLDVSRRMDATTVALTAFVPRAWLCLGCGAMSVMFTFGASTEAITLTLGLVLLAFQSFRRLASGLPALVAAWIAWTEARPLLGTPGAPESAGNALTTPEWPAAPGGDDAPASRMQAKGLSYRAASRASPVLDGIDLVMQTGDRILLEGPSGGGKSSIAAILAGLRMPSDGALLLDGLDRSIHGAAGWRRRVALAAQFHENHVFSGTFAFNLLLARRWPPTEQDLREATDVCEELGMGDLVDRMPAGLHEMVGECGWQLSHGERSRLFIARALLQGADFVVLDESLAALDPHCLQAALRCLQMRARALLVIAHP